MGTRSGIGLVDRNEQGKVTRVRGIYCHWDGYLEHNGVILAGSYRCPEKINALLDLGDISVLRNEVGEKHDFDTCGDDSPQCVNNWTTAYGRDRGEKDTETRVFTGARAVSQFRKALAASWAEYLYLFDKGRWMWCQPGDTAWKVLGSEFASPQEVA
jgi:hypothetical protein